MIYNDFIQDVIEFSFSKIEKKNEDGYYSELVICFSDEYNEANKKIEDYITNYIALSEKVRMSDSNSKHILRQLYKAFYNDITLVPDEILKNYFNKIKNRVSELKQSFLEEKTLKEINELDKILDSIIRDQIFLSFDKDKLDMKKVVAFHQMIKLIECNDVINNKIFVVNEYLDMIGYYLASLNDNDAKYLFKKIYK